MAKSENQVILAVMMKEREKVENSIEREKATSQTVYKLLKQKWLWQKLQFF